MSWYPRRHTNPCSRADQRRHAPLLLMVTATCAVLLLAACGNSVPSSTSLLKGARTKLDATQSFHFVMKVSHPGTPSAGTYVVNSATGDVVRPNSLSAAAQVNAGFVSVNVKLVIIGNQEWFTDPVSGKFVQTTEFASFLSLFDPSVGLGSLMTSLKNPSTPVDGSANGTSCWKISGTLAPDLLTPIFTQVTATGPVATSFCIGKSDGRLYSATLTGNIVDGDSSQTVRTFYLSNFDQHVTITPPPGV